MALRCGCFGKGRGVGRDEVLGGCGGMGRFRLEGSGLLALGGGVQCLTCLFGSSIFCCDQLLAL